MAEMIYSAVCGNCGYVLGQAEDEDSVVAQVLERDQSCPGCSGQHGFEIVYHSRSLPADALTQTLRGEVDVTLDPDKVTPEEAANLIARAARRRALGSNIRPVRKRRWWEFWK